MQTLKLSNCLFESVRNGTKRATIRDGIKNIIPGEMKFISPSGDDEETVHVTEVRYKYYSALDSLDAQIEGYKSVEELQNVILSYYPDIEGDRIITMVYFTPVGS